MNGDTIIGCDDHAPLVDGVISADYAELLQPHDHWEHHIVGPLRAKVPNVAQGSRWRYSEVAVGSDLSPAPPQPSPCPLLAVVTAPESVAMRPHSQRVRKAGGQRCRLISQWVDAQTRLI
jgi:hypothetical protein